MLQNKCHKMTFKNKEKAPKRFGWYWIIVTLLVTAIILVIYLIIS